MQFLLIVVISLVALGAIAAIFSIGGKDEPIVTKEGDCASCSSRTECKLAEVVDKRRKREIEEDKGQMTCGHHNSTTKLLSSISILLLLSSSIFFSCTTKKNTPTHGNPTEELEDYKTPLGVNVMINHVGDCFD